MPEAEDNQKGVEPENRNWIKRRERKEPSAAEPQPND
jgi:hypothetical protein